MPFIPAVNVAQAEMIFSYSGQICENVLHYLVAGGVDDAAMNFIAADLVSWWDVSMQPLVAPELSLTEVRITNMTSEFAPGVSWFAGLPLVGAAAGAMLPGNCALSITKRTANRGRAYRGRIYHMGLTEAQVTANNVLAGTITSLLAAYSLMRELDFAGTPLPMVVVSKYQGGDPRLTSLITPVAAFTTDGVIDSQRRRLPKRGT